PGHALPHQNFNLPQLHDNLFRLGSLDSHSWSSAFLTIGADHFKGGGSRSETHIPLIKLCKIKIKIAPDLQSWRHQTTLPKPSSALGMAVSLKDQFSFLRAPSIKKGKEIDD
ncbi:MAG: hypothetical protein ABJH07_11575, partial [Sedimentitalea sp.]|uniref:hypothetical protein n=1 Tax=Sedimentitalea sp. TaxID=2048915 RepID=UPI003299069F